MPTKEEAIWYAQQRARLRGSGPARASDCGGPWGVAVTFIFLAACLIAILTGH